MFHYHTHAQTILEIFIDLSSCVAKTGGVLPTNKSINSAKTTCEKWLVLAYFVAFSAGYAAIYRSAYLLSTKSLFHNLVQVRLESVPAGESWYVEKTGSAMIIL